MGKTFNQTFLGWGDEEQDYEDKRFKWLTTAILHPPEPDVSRKRVDSYKKRNIEEMKNKAWNSKHNDSYLEDPDSDSNISASILVRNWLTFCRSMILKAREHEI